jgi:hypothetical protein
MVSGAKGGGVGGVWLVCMCVCLVGRRATLALRFSAGLRTHFEGRFSKHPCRLRRVSPHDLFLHARTMARNASASGAVPGRATVSTRLHGRPQHKQHSPSAIEHKWLQEL